MGGASMILALTLVTAAWQAPTVPVWQIYKNQSDYGTHEVHATDPVETISGYRVTITRRGDGALPYTSNSIYKKTPEGKYAIYAHFGRVLLDPGEYLFESPDAGPLHNGGILANGEWMSLAEQSKYYGLTSNSIEYITATNLTGQPIRGLRFFVKTREDARFPVIKNVNYSFGSGRLVHVLRRETRTAYSTVASWDTANYSNAGGFLLTPGEYIVEVSSTARPAAYFQYLQICSGEYKPLIQ